jgi:hypothetical protein
MHEALWFGACVTLVQAVVREVRVREVVNNEYR